MFILYNKTVTVSGHFGLFQCGDDDNYVNSKQAGNTTEGLIE